MKDMTSNGTLLIVDDVPANISILFEFLTNSGYKVLVAQDGKKAIQKAEYAKPDLILLDVMMPGLDGFEACKILKSKDSTKEIPVIFMTALAETVDKVKGFNLGAVDYITKPIQQEEVLARVTSQLNFRNLQKQLKLHMEELETRNMELDAFARTVAHDLKNPLNIVIGLSDILIDDCRAKVNDESILENLIAVQQAGQKMISIIDALLLLAGVSKKAKVEKTALNMKEMVEQIVSQRLSHVIKQYKGQVTITDEWHVAQGFGPWIEEVWVNYISNALKYGGQPPEVRVGSTMIQEGKVKFWVQDNGNYLEPEACAQLFTPFTRLHQDRAEGHGLGLSIVQQVVEKLGGEVGVDSTQDQGNTFYFTLPTS